MTLDGITLLRYGFLSGSPAAQQQGRLRFSDGCVWIEPIFLGQPQNREAVIWPASTRLDNSAGTLRVLIGDSAIADGDEVTLGGGEHKDQEVLEGLVGPIPEACRSERFWLATDATR